MTATGRRLDALAVLQSRPGVTADELADRLGVTERTARRDVAHLRELGFRIDSAPGRHGGYRLAAGRTMPPLLLDADEVAAVALGLRGSLTAAGLEDAAATALAKLTQVVPSRWRPRLDAMTQLEAVRTGTRRRSAADVLVALALACRAGEAVRIRHRRGGRGSAVASDVQPYRLVAVRDVWYLVACRRDEPDWKVWALDRIEQVQPLGTRLAAPDAPPDAAAFVAERFSHAAWPHLVRVRIHAPGRTVRRYVDRAVATVVDESDSTCQLELRTDNLDWAARWLTYAGVDFDVLEPVELGERLRLLAVRIAASADSASAAGASVSRSRGRSSR